MANQEKALILEHLRKLAEENECDGIYREPRVFFDILSYAVGDPARKAGNPNIFRNGEKYPVRITHIVAAMLPGVVASPPLAPNQGDERMIQRYGMRIRAHDDWYMTPDFALLPLWNNVPQAANDVVTRGSATWRFRTPFILGARDSMNVSVELEQAPDGNRTVGVAFNGVGMLSRRPKQLSGQVTVTSTLTPVQIDLDRYRSDGPEPIEIHNMVCHVSANSNDTDPTGDIRQARVEIQQVGHGTNQTWMTGPVTGDQHCPMVLLGPTTGRCVVHELPITSGGEPGWLWVPGEGVSIELEAVTTNRAENVAVGMLGYAIVQ